MSQSHTKRFQSRAELRSEIDRWAARINVKPRCVRIIKMKRKLASCSTKGTLCFSTKLLEEPRPFQEYVVVHELLHLIVPNHGKLFKSLLKAYLPDYERVSAPGVLIYR